MKQSWARLVSMFRIGTGQEREARFVNLFMRHHRNATTLIFTHDKKPLAAVYLTPLGHHQSETIKLFRQLRDELQYAYEREDGE